MSDSTDSAIGTIHELLEKNRFVAIIWTIDDVQGIRPDLTDDQAWQILQECNRSHDCEFGFNWQFIEDIAEDAFPNPVDE